MEKLYRIVHTPTDNVKEHWLTLAQGARLVRRYEEEAKLAGEENAYESYRLVEEAPIRVDELLKSLGDTFVLLYNLDSRDWLDEGYATELEKVYCFAGAIVKSLSFTRGNSLVIFFGWDGKIA